MLCYTDLIVSFDSMHISYNRFYRPRIKRFFIVFLVESVAFHIMLQQSRIRILRRLRGTLQGGKNAVNPKLAQCYINSYKGRAIRAANL